MDTNFREYKDLLKTVYKNKQEYKKQQLKSLLKEINQAIVKPSRLTLFSPRAPQIRQQQLEFLLLDDSPFSGYLENLSKRKNIEQDAPKIANQYINKYIKNIKNKLQHQKSTLKRFASTYPARGNTVEQMVVQTPRRKTIMNMPPAPTHKAGTSITPRIMTDRQFQQRLRRLTQGSL